MVHSKYVSLVVVLGMVAATGSGLADTIIYSEDFSPTFTAGAEFLEDFSISLGGDAGANNKEVVLGQWGVTASGTFAGNNLEPQNDGANNAKLGGVFLDPALFVGAGLYTLHYDVIGADAGSSYVYVSAGSGYDESNFLVLDLDNGGFSGGAWQPLSATGTASASNLASASVNTTVSGSFTLDFTYDGSSTIALAFGAYNSDVGFDNIEITTTVPEPSTIAMVLVGAGSLFMARRKRFS